MIKAKLAPMSTLREKEALEVGLHRRLALHPSLVQLGGLERCASSITIELVREQELTDGRLEPSFSLTLR